MRAKEVETLEWILLEPTMGFANFWVLSTLSDTAFEKLDLTDDS